MTEPQVRAAGGALWRPAPNQNHDGAIEVLVVHRPRYDDWTLPKGKCEPGEGDLDAALREVNEETGLSVAVGDELVSTNYVDHRGRTKQVRYWAMTVTSGSFSPNDEVDEVRWLALDEAASKLSYVHDRDVLASLERTVGNVCGSFTSG